MATNVGDGVGFKGSDGEDRDALCKKVHSDTTIDLVWVNEGGTVNTETSVAKGDGPRSWSAEEDNE